MRITLIGILLCITTISYSQVDLNLGLKAHYTFSGNANDVSGNGLNGIPQGGVLLTSDRFGNPNSAYEFDGINDVIVVTDNGALSTPAFSICYYVMTTANTYQNCIGKIDYISGAAATYNTGIMPGPNPRFYFGTIGTAGTCADIVAGTLVYTTFSNEPVQTNRWYCIVNTYENGLEKIYVDGALVTQQGTPFNNATYCTNTTFQIGSWWQGDPYRFKGKMDDIRFYNRVISNDEIKALCDATTPCNNWLSTPIQGSYFSAGDNDISGVNLTVEAKFNRTQPYIPNSGNDNEGDIVSKHLDPANVNYLLRPNHASITTSNGFYQTPDVCEIELNKTYHVAMTYDGSTLKFYRNGFLLSQIPATGTLHQNDYPTRIGRYTGIFTENLLGFINDVRIWNTTRSQEEIRANMDISISNPPAQIGLQAYYTFDNLINKQGNPAWNGTLSGGASINAVNTSCDFVIDSCNINPATDCSNWLNTPVVGSYVNLGDLDISGNQLTLEAVINRTEPYTPGTGDDSDGDIISKHLGPPNTNYLLRPNHGYITTTNGFFATPDVCEIELNKTYHIALVYNGTSLKFYRNGFLMGETPATGNLFQNDFPTRLGLFTGPTIETFKGYMNEVRIWKMARTQEQIRAYMSVPLPAPTAQPFLEVYYTFDNLQNKQGNPTWNGTLGGSAAINATNPSCDFIADSCFVTVPGDTIINDYTSVISSDICKNIITVSDASKYSVGDTVVIMQMAGAIADTTNTASFGSLLNIKNAGNYEFNIIKTKNGNSIELLNILTRQYDLPNGKVQLIRVPYLSNFSSLKKLTALAWDGSKGGVVVLNVKDNIDLQADIDVSGKGFLAGVAVNRNSTAVFCGENNYFYPATVQLLSNTKGTGIFNLMDNKSFGRGAALNAGGGGNAYNSGGGGGGNAGTGGMGGFQFANCTPSGFDNRGIGAYKFNYVSLPNKIFMGGSGGAGHANNSTGFISNGGNGGGIIIIRSATLKANGNNIISNGHNAVECGNTDISCHEGMGGGGAGGTVVADIISYSDNVNIITNGGKGGDMTSAGNEKIGPGGGGGGGITMLRQTALPANVTLTSSGGINGVCTAYGNNVWGTTPGENGTRLLSVTLPVSTVLFKPNIDSVRFTAPQTGCRSFNFVGVPFVNDGNVATWAWSFGDGSTANTQNTSHTYTNHGTFPVKVVITDMNGCKDSVTRNVTTTVVTVDAGLDTTYCSNTAVTRTLHATGSGPWQWTPVASLDNPNAQHPVATINSTTKYYVSVTDALGCSGIDSITITIKPLPNVTTLIDSAICKGSPFVLTTTGATTYSWTPAAFVSNPLIASPDFTGTASQTLTVTGTDANGCIATDMINVTVKPLPVVKTLGDSLICSTQSIILTTTGAQTYSWSPAAGLDDPASATPIFNGAQSSSIYYVTGTGINNCSAKDTISITVRKRGELLTPPNKEMCLKGSVVLNGNNGNNVDYAWAPSATLSNAGIINPVASPAVTQIYKLTITDRICSYDSNFSVSVTVNPLPVVDASRSNDITCSQPTSRLSATGATQYLWTPSSTLLTSANTANPIAKPVVNTLYTVKGTNVKGCSNTDTVTVFIKTALGGFAIPNTFTPNGDRTNECFGIKHWGVVDNLIFIIYNRWGEKVFETSNTNICWNGKFRGQDAEPGSYVYYIKGKTGCGELERKGNVLLIR